MLTQRGEMVSDIANFSSTENLMSVRFIFAPKSRQTKIIRLYTSVSCVVIPLYVIPLYVIPLYVMPLDVIPLYVIPLQTMLKI